MKMWEQHEDTHDGWWAAAGRIRGWCARPWCGVRNEQFVLSPFGLFGISVCWATGIYVSVGVSFIGHVGIGYIRRGR